MKFCTTALNSGFIMVPSFIIHQAAENYQRAYVQLQYARVEGAAEFIHAFRVEVKSFNGIVLYLKEILASSHNLLDQIMMDLKPYYKSSGKVRNITVIQDLMLQHKETLSDDFFLSYLDEQMKARLCKFKEVCAIINLPASIELSEELNRLNSMSVDYDELFYSHLKSNKNKAIHLIKGNLPGEEWHTARAFFKRNYLLLKLVSEEVVDPDEMNESRFLEQELGSWHDLIMLKKAYTKFEAAQNVSSSSSSRFLESIEEIKSVHINKIRELI